MPFSATRAGAGVVGFTSSQRNTAEGGLLSAILVSPKAAARIDYMNPAWSLRGFKANTTHQKNVASFIVKDPKSANKRHAV